MHADEAERLRALEAYGVLDTPATPAFDRITALAADLFDAPIALVSLIDAERQWFKSHHGLDACATPREWAFCDHAMGLAPGEVMVVEDAASDARFTDNPLVTGRPDIRFYAGAVLTSPAGHNLGTLCVIDTKPRPRPTEVELGRLRILAQVVVEELERGRTLREADEKRRLLELAEGMAKVGHWRYRLGDRHAVWSDEIYRIYGVERDGFEPTFANVAGALEPGGEAELGERISTAVASGQGFEMRMRVRRPDGALREVTCKATCELDHQGRVRALFGVIQDVTHHTRVLREVDRSRARYKLLTDTVGDVITRLRLDGTSGYISPAVERLLGYKPDEMSGTTAQSFVYEPDQPILLAAFKEMAKGCDERTVQIRAARKDGTPVWVEAHLRLLRDGFGEPAEMVAAIRDIGDRKALEEELRQARAEAEAAAAVKGDFLANMSHELRTPLTAVMGFSRLAREQPELQPDTRVMLDRAVYAGKALLSTINDLLDFSKLEAGQLEIKPAPASPAGLARDTLDIFSAQAETKGLSLEAQGLDALPETVAVDSDRVRQVLLNLIGNAVKFTGEGAVRLEVEHDGASLRFVVIDSGPGIPADRIGDLFKRFSQVDGSSPRRHGGTGLGLAICRGLVEAMGGEIGVDSELGRGARFWFTLPAPLAAAPSVAETLAAESPAFEGRRLLVADDNAANRILLRALLAPFGVDIEEAADGEAAVAAAQTAPFDAILMDLRMPVLSGLAAGERIRGMPGPNRTTPLVAFSADEPKGAALKVFDAYVAKPVMAAALIAALVRVFSPAAETELARAG